MLAEGFAKAASLAVHALQDRQAHLRPLREQTVRVIEAAGGIVLGAPELQVGNTVSAYFPGCDGATVAMALDLEGICVSTGSACSSGVAQASATMRALGLTEEEGRAVIRVSLGKDNNAAEIERLGQALMLVIRRSRVDGAVNPVEASA